MSAGWLQGPRRRGETRPTPGPACAPWPWDSQAPPRHVPFTCRDSDPLLGLQCLSSAHSVACLTVDGLGGVHSCVRPDGRLELRLGDARFLMYLGKAHAPSPGHGGTREGSPWVRSARRSGRSWTRSLVGCEGCTQSPAQGLGCSIWESCPREALGRLLGLGKSPGLFWSFSPCVLSSNMKYPQKRVCSKCGPTLLRCVCHAGAPRGVRRPQQACPWPVAVAGVWFSPSWLLSHLAVSSPCLERPRLRSQRWRLRLGVPAGTGVLTHAELGRPRLPHVAVL